MNLENKTKSNKLENSELPKMKLAVLISGSGTNLQSLINAEKSNYFQSEIALVISNRKSAYGLTRAQEAGIKTMVIKSDDELVDVLLENEIDMVVLAGYLSIFSPKVIETFENRIINIHPSLLPAYGGHGMYGLNVHKKVFEDKAKTTGATVHYVTNVIDVGPIILQKHINIDYDVIKSPEELQQAVLVIEHQIFKEAIKKLEE